MRLFVSDLDGTLLDGSGRLSAFARRELERLLERDLPFTVASARSAASIRPIFDGLPLRLPVIEFNGAFLTDLASGRHLLCRALAPAIVEALVEEGTRRGLPPFLSAFDGAADRLHFLPPVNEGWRWYVEDRTRARDARVNPVRDLRPYLGEQIVCLTFIGLSDAIEPLCALVEERFLDRVRLTVMPNMYNPGWLWMTVHDREATKARAIETLAADLGIAMADVTVFGDEVNDIPMFEAAGRAVAVGNAHPRLKAAAHAVIEPHGADSVVRYLLACWPPSSARRG